MKVGNTAYLAPERIMRIAVLLVVACLVSCAARNRKSQSNEALAPSGTFTNFFLKLHLNSDGTYLAHDLARRQDFVVEGTTLFLSRTDTDSQKGTWTYDKRTGNLRLRADYEGAWRYNLSHLRYDGEEPGRVTWCGGFLGRTEGSPR